MKIRKLETSDGELLLALLLKLDKETSFMLYEPGERISSVEDMEDRITIVNYSGGINFGVEHKNELVGFITAHKGNVNRNKHSAYIVIGVLEKASGKGLGSKLLSKVDEWAIESNVTKIELTVMVHNDIAFNLYKKMGYEVEGTKRNSIIVNGKVYDEYYMGKILSDN